MDKLKKRLHLDKFLNHELDDDDTEDASDDTEDASEDMDSKKTEE